MSRTKDHGQALILRKSGMSYSQISGVLGINKSTLSGWLKNYPLKKSRIRELRDFSPQRIEKYRATMQKKREVRLHDVFEGVCKEMKNGKMPKDIYAGFFLYWAEGTKSAPCTTALTNSDPAMISFFIAWLIDQKVPRGKLRIKLHLYQDMDISTHMTFWSSTLAIPLSQFYKPYIKVTTERSKTYKGMFAHGTCTVIYHNRDMYEYIMAVMKYLQGKSI